MKNLLYSILSTVLGFYIGFCIGNFGYLCLTNNISKEHILKSLIPATLIDREIFIEDLQKENSELISEIKKLKNERI